MKLLKVIPLFLLVFSGSAFSHDPLTTDAMNLARAAHHFAGLVRYKTGYSHLYYDAKKVAFIASGLTSSVASSSNPVVVKSQFRKVKTRFLQLSHQMRHAHTLHHNRHIQHDFFRLKDSFYRLEHTVRNSVY